MSGLTDAGRTYRGATGGYGAVAAPRSAKLNFTSVVSHIAFGSCLCLQRFGIPFADSTVSICLPIFAGLVVWMLASGRGRIEAKTALAYLLFAIWTLFSAVAAVEAPDPRVGFSLFSLIELMLLYALMTVRPSGDFDGATVQRVFLFYARLCAVFGIVQFLLQFVRVRLFSFGVLFPPLNPWLLEHDFAWNPLLRYGSNILRSNGFFLLEPSIFSQVLALAIMLDFFVLGRRRYLPLYLIAYMTSYSGTGLVSLILTLGLVGLTSLKNSRRVITMVLAGAITLGIFSLVFPDQVATYVNRFGELGSSQSSGHARYVAQWTEIQAFSGEVRSLLGYGPGATMRSIYWTAGSGNPALQLFIDYGLVGLGLFCLYLIATLGRKRNGSMVILLLTIFQLGGGYLLFAPMTLLMASLGVWASEGRTVPSAAPSRKRPAWAFPRASSRPT